MDILDLVAAEASRTDPLVAFAGMVRGAGDGSMRVAERKLRGVVIERLGAAPFSLAVAFVARIAQPALVRILCLMTVNAAPWRIAKFGLPGMTAVALHRDMRVMQREIRKGVIEGFAVEQDNVGFATLVIRVAMIAVPLGGIRLTSVKSLARRTIGGNFLVACKA